MALGLTQPVTEMSTRNISWGFKGGQLVGLTTLPTSCADCLEIWEPQPPGTLRAGIALPLPCFTWFKPGFSLCLSCPHITDTVRSVVTNIRPPESWFSLRLIFHCPKKSPPLFAQITRLQMSNS